MKWPINCWLYFYDLHSRSIIDICIFYNKINLLMYFIFLNIFSFFYSFWFPLSVPTALPLSLQLVKINYMYKSFSCVKTLYKTLPKWLRHVNHMWYELNEYTYFYLCRGVYSMGHWSHGALIPRGFILGQFILGWNLLWWIALGWNPLGINAPWDQCL